jgi:hypothetical protein
MVVITSIQDHILLDLTAFVCNYLLLRDDFRIGLVISPRVAVINHKMGIYKIDIFIN